jgi:hypothetical protein
LIGVLFGIGGCSEDAPTRPEEFEDFGVFAIQLGGFDGDSADCDGHDARPLSIRMSRLEGTGDASSILLEIEGTPAEFVIGGPAGTKIAIFNNGGHAFPSGADVSCVGGDAGRVNIVLDQSSDVSAAEALDWTFSNPLEETVISTRNWIAPIAYYVTRGGRGAGGNDGSHANVFVGSTLVPPEAFDGAPPFPLDVIGSLEPVFGEGHVYDVTEDLRAFMSSECREDVKYRLSWGGPGERPDYSRVE